MFSLKRAAHALEQATLQQDNSQKRQREEEGKKGPEPLTRGQRQRTASCSEDAWTRLNADVVLFGGYDIKGVTLAQPCRRWQAGATSRPEIDLWKELLALGSPGLKANVTLLQAFQEYRDMSPMALADPLSLWQPLNAGVTVRNHRHNQLAPKDTNSDVSKLRTETSKEIGQMAETLEKWRVIADFPSRHKIRFCSTFVLRCKVKWSLALGLRLSNRRRVNAMRQCSYK
jgi:hypothetical protein